MDPEVWVLLTLRATVEGERWRLTDERKASRRGDGSSSSSSSSSPESESAPSVDDCERRSVQLTAPLGSVRRASKLTELARSRPRLDDFFIAWRSVRTGGRQSGLAKICGLGP